MITKERLMQNLQGLPDKFSFDELMDRIILLKKIEIGLEQSNESQTHSTEDAKLKLKKWLK